MPGSKHDFAPRLSLAMQLRPTLVVRAGYGLYYNSGASQISNLLSGAFYGGVPGGFVAMKLTTPHRRPPASLKSFSRRRRWLWEPSRLYRPGTGYYGDGAYQTVFYADQKSFRTPYIHRYLLDIQQEVGHNSAITVSYIGAEGGNGWYFVNANAAPIRRDGPTRLRTMQPVP